MSMLDPGLSDRRTKMRIIEGCPVPVWSDQPKSMKLNLNFLAKSPSQGYG